MNYLYSFIFISEGNRQTHYIDYVIIWLLGGKLERKQYY